MSWNCPKTSDSAGQELQNLIEIYHLNQQPFIDQISQDLTILIEVLSLFCFNEKATLFESDLGNSTCVLIKDIEHFPMPSTHHKTSDL